MSDPILLFLAADAVALLLAGALAAAVPARTAASLTTALSGLGLLGCLPPLLVRALPAARTIPFGPPGVSLHLALDPLSLFFLVIVLLNTTALAAFQAVSRSHAPEPLAAPCAAGAILSLLAADGVTLAIGLAVTAVATGRAQRNHLLLVPLLLLFAVCLLTPPGYAPRFDAIRAAPLDPSHAAAAIVLTLGAVAALAWPAAGPRCRSRDALSAGVLIPAGFYLLLRLAADLCAAAPQAASGSVVLLAGATAAVIQGRRAATSPDIDTAIAALLRQQAAIGTVGIGLALIARAADLAGASRYALQATCLTAIGASLAGTLTALAAQIIAEAAGSTRLTRLGGLVHTMPTTSVALAAGLLALSALPPGLGFAALWLALQSILAAPRTGGLPAQLPLALAAAALTLSAALATAAALRVAGIGLLGRPRTPRGAGATETRPSHRVLLRVLAAATLLFGVLPGQVLALLAEPAIRTAIGLPPETQGETVPAAVSYPALPVFALLALATGAALLVRRRSGKEAKTTGPWTDGLPPAIGLPFGEPAAQSAGAGFLPALPDLTLGSWPPRQWLTLRLSTMQPPSPRAGPWLVLAAFAALLLALTIAA